MSTNAAGLRLSYYGSLNKNVTGMEVCLADGTILDLFSKVKKDNTGKDFNQFMHVIIHMSLFTCRCFPHLLGPKLHQLFIGAEGIFVRHFVQFKII